jgi:hypothetical protein
MNIGIENLESTKIVVDGPSVSLLSIYIKNLIDLEIVFVAVPGKIPGWPYIKEQFRFG